MGPSSAGPEMSRHGHRKTSDSPNPSCEQYLLESLLASDAYPIPRPRGVWHGLAQPFKQLCSTSILFEKVSYLPSLQRMERGNGISPLKASVGSDTNPAFRMSLKKKGCDQLVSLRSTVSFLYMSSIVARVHFLAILKDGKNDHRPRRAYPNG